MYRLHIAQNYQNRVQAVLSCRLYVQTKQACRTHCRQQLVALLHYHRRHLRSESCCLLDRHTTHASVHVTRRTDSGYRLQIWHAGRLCVDFILQGKLVT